MKKFLPLLLLASISAHAMQPQLLTKTRRTAPSVVMPGVTYAPLATVAPQDWYAFRQEECRKAPHYQDGSYQSIEDDSQDWVINAWKTLSGQGQEVAFVKEQHDDQAEPITRMATTYVVQPYSEPTHQDVLSTLATVRPITMQIHYAEPEDHKTAMVYNVVSLLAYKQLEKEMFYRAMLKAKAEGFTDLFDAEPTCAIEREETLLSLGFQKYGEPIIEKTYGTNGSNGVRIKLNLFKRDLTGELPPFTQDEADTARTESPEHWSNN